MLVGEIGTQSSLEHNKQQMTQPKQLLIKTSDCQGGDHVVPSKPSSVTHLTTCL